MAIIQDAGTKRTTDDIEIHPTKQRKGPDGTIYVNTDNQTEEYREVSTLYWRT
jgi:replicative DNA helicase